MTNKAWRTLILGGIVFFVLPALAIQAQGGGSELVGVISSDGGPLPGIQVHLYREGKLVATEVTQLKPLGTYRFKNLAPGEYSMEVVPSKESGYQKILVKSVYVQSGINKMDFKLQSLAATADVTRVIDRGKPTTPDAKAGLKLNRTQVENLPNIGNDVRSLVDLAPGVSTTADGEIRVRGATTYDTDVRIDNVSVSDPFAIFGTNSGVDISTEAIETVEITTGGFDVSQVGFQGGQVKFFTRQGKNEFEGSIGMDFESDFFSRDFGQKWLRPSDFGYTRIEPSLTFGGPFIKDEFFFFGNLVLRDVSQGGSKFTSLNRQYRTFTYESSGIRNFLLNLSYQINQKNKIRFQYTGSRNEDSHYLNFNPARNDFVPPDSDILTKTQGHLFLLSGESLLNKNLNLESTFSVQVNHRTDGPTSTAFEPLEIPCSLLPDKRRLEEGIRVICDGDITLGPYSVNSLFRSRAIQVEEKFNHFLDEKLGGNHRLLYGGRIELNDLKYGYTTIPRHIYNVVEPGATEQFVDVLHTYNQPRTDNLRFATLYFQDSFRFSDRWTLSLGFNTMYQKITTFGYDPKETYDDFLTIPGRSEADMLALNSNCLDPDFLQSTDSSEFWSSSDGIAFWRCMPVDMASETAPIHPASASLLIPTLFNYLNRAEEVSYGGTKFSPAFQMIWRPYGEDKTVVTASFGRQYGKIAYTAGLETTETLIRGSFDETDAVDDNPCDLTGADSKLGCYNRPDFFIMDRNIRIPYTDEVQVQVKRDVTDLLGVEVRYVNRRGKDRIFEKDLNFTVDSKGEAGLPKNKNFNRIRFFTNLEDYSYEAVEIQITKQSHRNWQLTSNYTYSKTFGISDTIFNESSDDDVQFTVIPEPGPFRDDQRHAANIALVNFFPGDFKMGTTIKWASGYPYSMRLRSFLPGIGLAETYSGGRNAFNNPSYWTVDVGLTKDFRIGKRGQASMVLQITNLFNNIYIADQDILINNFTSGDLRTGSGAIGAVGSGDAGLTLNADPRVAYAFGRNYQFTFKYKF